MVFTLLRLFNALLVFVIAFIVLSIVIVILQALGISIASAIAGVLAPFVMAIAILLGVISFFGGFPTTWSLLK